ncbi:hypothetical protein DUNSADRAFT_16542 [Dunaliella salina]|uniref:Uncharacterized protein n=1 Tax=Dunaliella salina TaxID=3046 RepID=A0ABQ7G3C6_DUNSA|nr:hypothetical protein DUNSADRAFT_16542 [Dunaliella salina]|eukprot:KAF5829105.1 hypothetical protein DUNSADRAFT_16542 [Dunaliella salina]
MPPTRTPQPLHAHPPTPADSVHGQKQLHFLHHHHPLPTLPKDPQSGVLQQPWVCVDAAGNSTVITEGRIKLITELGIQGRDLRLLEEPPSGGTFLVRENAIIASLDFACIIITTKAAYIVNPSEPATIKFMTLLKQRLAFAAANLPAANGFSTWEEKEQQLLVQAHAESGKQSRPHLWRSSSKSSTKSQHTQSQEQQAVSSPPKHMRFRHHHHHHHHKGSHPDWMRPRSTDKDFPMAFIPSKGREGKGKSAPEPPPLPASNGPPAPSDHGSAPQLSPFYIAATTTPSTNWQAAPQKPHHQDFARFSRLSQQQHQQQQDFTRFSRLSQQQQQQQHQQQQQQQQQRQHKQEEQHYGKAHFVPQKPATLPITQGMYTQQLPFELRVLELCLYELCSRLAMASAQLEAMAMPLVDILLNQAELAVLEDLRFAKKQLADLTTKASRVCDLLKSFLDDDTDMWDMHLTAKETQRTAAQEAAARMMEEVTAMAEQAAHMPRLEKVRLAEMVA